MGIRPRSEIVKAPTVPHGGFHAALAADVLDFSSNVNPFGPSPKIWDAMRAVPIARHPDSHSTELRELLAERNALDPTQLIVGNGTADLIFQIAFAYLRAGDRVLIAGPTFGEYARAAALVGADVVEFRARAEDGFELDFAALTSAARAVNPRLVFLCNPNNPTGAYFGLSEMERLARACPETLFILDEAFIQFVRDSWDACQLIPFDNLLVLRSMTKDYALTALRIGYAMSSRPIIETLERVQPPWSVNALAQAAAVAAMRDKVHLRETLAALADAKADLVEKLARMGLAILPSRTNFFLMRVGASTPFAKRLLDQGILVRDCASFGLPEFVRIAARKPEENARLVQAIQESECAQKR